MMKISNKINFKDKSLIVFKTISKYCKSLLNLIKRVLNTIGFNNLFNIFLIVMLELIFFNCGRIEQKKIDAKIIQYYQKQYNETAEEYTNQLEFCRKNHYVLYRYNENGELEVEEK